MLLKLSEKHGGWRGVPWQKETKNEEGKAEKKKKEEKKKEKSKQKLSAGARVIVEFWCCSVQLRILTAIASRDTKRFGFLMW